MIAIRRLEQINLQPRDFTTLYAVRSNPGIAGAPLAHKIGYATRSGIRDSAARLQVKGFIEDRRQGDGLTPSQYYTLPAGREFLAEIASMLEPSHAPMQDVQP